MHLKTLFSSNHQFFWLSPKSRLKVPWRCQTLGLLGDFQRMSPERHELAGLILFFLFFTYSPFLLMFSSEGHWYLCYNQVCLVNHNSGIKFAYTHLLYIFAGLLMLSIYLKKMDLFGLILFTLTILMQLLYLMHLHK